ncbi:unnamed protein product, partial [Symbiodinium pilosum]
MSGPSSSSQSATSYLTVLENEVTSGTGLSMRMPENDNPDYQTFAVDENCGFHLAAAPAYVLSRKGWFHGAEGCQDGDPVHLWKDIRGGPNGGNQRFLVKRGQLLLEGTQLAVSRAGAGGICLRQSPHDRALTVCLRDYDASVPRVALTWTEQVPLEMQAVQSSHSANGPAGEALQEMEDGHDGQSSQSANGPAGEMQAESERLEDVPPQALQEMEDGHDGQSSQSANGPAGEVQAEPERLEDVLPQASRKMQDGQSPQSADASDLGALPDVNAESGCLQLMPPEALCFYIGDSLGTADEDTLPWCVCWLPLSKSVAPNGLSFVLVRGAGLAAADFEAVVNSLKILKEAQIQIDFTPKNDMGIIALVLDCTVAAKRCGLPGLYLRGDHGAQQKCADCGKDFVFELNNVYIADP